MPGNIEIKARVADLARTRELAAGLDVSERFSLQQTDTFFVTARARLKLREFGDGSAELIAYDRPDTSGAKLSDYRRVPVADAAALAEALAMTHATRGVVRKRRDVMIVGQTRIHLDEVDGLGQFVELEVVLADGDSHDQGQQIAADLMRALAIEADALIGGAYIDMLEASA